MMSSRVHTSLLYVLAVLILGISAGVMQDAKNRGWLRVIKKPLPIRKPLLAMDRSCLQPFRLVVSHPLRPEVEAELGTTEYINWIVDLPGVNQPWQGQAALSVTYYTDKQDQVPHVSEECMYQAGFSQMSDETLEMEMPGVDRTMAIRRLSFSSPRHPETNTYVYYVICVNNDFFPGRRGARFRIMDDQDTHLFYAKVEVSLEAVDEGRLSEADECARELLDNAIAELVRSHWPLKGWERGGPPPSTG